MNFIPPNVVYRRTPANESWWCNSHKRKATHIRNNGGDDVHCCDPDLGGIMLPCRCVNIADEAEVE